MNKQLLVQEFDKIRNNIVTIFWLTESQTRTERIALLERIGAIRRTDDDLYSKYPNMIFLSNKDKLDEWLKEQK